MTKTKSCTKPALRGLEAAALDVLIEAGRKGCTRIETMTAHDRGVSLIPSWPTLLSALRKKGFRIGSIWETHRNRFSTKDGRHKRYFFRGWEAPDTRRGKAKKKGGQ